MLRDDLSRIVSAAVHHLIEAGELSESVRRVPVEILDTRQPEHGDYATNFPLTASKVAGVNPRTLAESLRIAILSADQSGTADPLPGQAKMVFEGSPPNPDRPRPILHRVDIAGPGFLNFRLKPEAITSHLTRILALGPDLPNTRPPKTRKINVEFVSVNPNGPITVGSGRGAAFGDSLCRVLEAAGNQVHREYYVNDGVNSEQMRLFAESVRHYYRAELGIESTFPENGYRGDYVQEVAARVRELFGDGHEEAESIWFQRRSEELMLERQREDLHAFGVDFDTWFSEQSLHDSGTVARCIEELVTKGAADEAPYRTVLKLGKGGVIEEVTRQSQVEAIDDDSQDVEDPPEPPPPTPSPSAPRTSAQGEGPSTLWLRSTKFGDDMDRVLRRRDGRLTYIASDVAYHKDKLTDASGTRGTGPVDGLITILGPDHHGYIARLQAVVAALLESPIPADEAPGSPSPFSAGGVPESPSPFSANEAPESPSPFSAGPASCGASLGSRENGEGAGGEASGTSNLDLLYSTAEEKNACLRALAEARHRLKVVIFQIVRFMKEGKPAPMRKRDGNIYDLRDLIRELGAAVSPRGGRDEQQRIGADVARFFYLTRSHDTSMDFDIDLATKQSDENPVFYVQYAHARICSVLSKAKDAISEPPETDANPSLLTHPCELALIKKILDLPWEVMRCAEDYGVHRLTTYAMELARTYHHFYDACRVIQPNEPELSQARIALCEAARIGIRATLDLLGVSAPDRMDRENAPNHLEP